MDKRLLVAVAISIGILMLWWKVFPPAPPAPAPAPTAVAPAQPVPTGYDAGTGAALAGPPNPAAAAPTEGQAAPTQPAVRPPEAQIVLESPEANYVFSTWGASLRQIKLKDRQFLLDRSRPESGMQIVSTSGEERAPLRTTFAKPDFAWADNLLWTATQASPTEVVFRAETADVVVEKRFVIEGRRYRLAMTVTMTNKTARALDSGLVVHLYAAQDPAKKGGGFFDYASANLAELVCFVSDKVQRATVEDLVKEPHSYVGGVRWAAAGDKYFTIAAVPMPENPPRERGCKQHSIDTT